MIYVCMHPQSNDNDFFLNMYSSDPIPIRNIDSHATPFSDVIGVGGMSRMNHKTWCVENEIYILTHDVYYCDKDTFLQIVNNKHNLPMFRMS